MITNETITARFTADRHATIAWKRQLSADLDAIITAYGAADKPADTIADAMDADAIHPAHIDQLARAAAEYVEPETTETTETTETAPAAETETETVETAERAAEIADALDDIRRERVAYSYGYRAKQRVTARCLREAERAGRPTVRVGYCDLYGALSGIDPDYYTAGVYGWNCDVYVIAGLAICTGYRPAAGVRAVGVRELAEACRGADTATRDRLFAAWIVTNRERAREGARA